MKDLRAKASLTNLKSLINYLVVESLEQKTLALTGVADVARLQVAASRLPEFWRIRLHQSPPVLTSEKPLMEMLTCVLAKAAPFSVSNCPSINTSSNGTSIRGDKNIAHMLNRHFTSIGPKLAATMPKNNNYLKYLKKYETELSFKKVTDLEIELIISKLDKKKSTGFDHISNSLVRDLRTSIVRPLMICINKSLEEGTVPFDLKVAKITPLFKSGDRENVTNYRPISLLPVFSKVLEKVVYEQTIEYFDPYITKCQFGFRRKHSTVHCIMNYLNNISANCKNKYQISIFIDLRKAFDTVPHDKLLKKLEAYGVKNIALNWFKSYLTDRHQSTQIRKENSALDLISCGVPQGSILGPLLFLIFINDLPGISEFMVSLFADDTTLQISGNNLNNLESKINTELVKIHNWFTDNLLSLHPKKTNFIVVKLRNKSEDATINLQIDGTKLEQCGRIYHKKAVKFLGMMVDDELSWNEHVVYVENKMRKIRGNLGRKSSSIYKNGLQTKNAAGFPTIWGRSSVEQPPPRPVSQKYFGQ